MRGKELLTIEKWLEKGICELDAHLHKKTDLLTKWFFMTFYNLHGNYSDGYIFVLNLLPHTPTALINRFRFIAVAARRHSSVTR